MDRFASAALQPSGDLTMQGGETKLCTVADVSLSALPKHSTSTKYTSGVLIITTHRLAWVSTDRRRSVAISLAELRRNKPLEPASTLRGARGELVFAHGQRVRVDVHGSGASARRDAARTTVNDAVRKAQWEIDARAAAAKKRAEEQKKIQEANSKPVLEAARVGIGGAVRGVQERSEARAGAIAAGFSSLDGLRAAAEELMVVARALQGSPAGGAGKNEDNALLQAMAAAGIPSPVTKASVAGGGEFYRAEVARETATFLTERLPLLGGLITVADAYALVMRNRASAELVSPADFGAAVNMLPSLGVGLSVTKLPGGVRAIQADCGVGAGAESLLKLVEERASVGAVDVATLRRVPLARALAMLEQAEQAGLLARDETDGVLRFFPNKFSQFVK